MCLTIHPRCVGTVACHDDRRRLLAQEQHASSAAGVRNSPLAVDANRACVDGAIEGIVGAAEEHVVIWIYPPAGACMQHRIMTEE